jgi:CHASE2 domain-containing sensor protein
MFASKSKLGFLKQFRAAIPALLLAIAGTYVLSRLGILARLEHVVLDTEMAANVQASADIRVVNITDSDYDVLFGGDPEDLHPSVLHDLIDAIARSRPAVIAVDIDTSHSHYRNFHLESSWPKVIWERDISNSGQAADLNSPSALPEYAEVEPSDVLGGQDPRLNKNSGLPLLFNDPDDKVTRLYTRCIETKAGVEPSFVYAIVSAYRTAHANGRSGAAPTCENGADRPLQPFFIEYSLRPESSLMARRAAQVLGLSGKKQDGGLESAIPEFKDRIVLLGGTYRDFDRHATPIGNLAGVMVLANAIQTELGGHPVGELSRGWLFVLEFLSGTLLVVLFSVFSLAPWKLFASGLLASAAISLGVSYLSFHTMSRFANFAPTLLAVLAFEIYEHVRHKSILQALKSEKKTEPAGQEAKR